MDRKTAKELLHRRDWLDRAQEIVDRGKDTYLREDLLQEAGDSLMMKRTRSRTGTGSSTSTTKSTARSRGRPSPGISLDGDRP